MQRPATTSAPATASTPSPEQHGADTYGGDLRDLRQALLDPPEFVFRGEPLRLIGAGRARAIRDDAAAWFD
jgi:hypothetical protein